MLQFRKLSLIALALLTVTSVLHAQRRQSPRSTKALPQPDLRMTELKFIRKVVRIKVINQGQMATPQGQVFVRAIDKRTNRVVRSAYAPLLPLLPNRGDIITLSTFANVRNVRLEAWADPANRIKESNEGNNRLTLDIRR